MMALRCARGVVKVKKVCSPANRVPWLAERGLARFDHCGSGWTRWTGLCRQSCFASDRSMCAGWCARIRAPFGTADIREGANG